MISIISDEDDQFSVIECEECTPVASLEQQAHGGQAENFIQGDPEDQSSSGGALVGLVDASGALQGAKQEGEVDKSHQNSATVTTSTQRSELREIQTCEVGTQMSDESPRDRSDQNAQTTTMTPGEIQTVEAAPKRWSYRRCGSVLT